MIFSEALHEFIDSSHWTYAKTMPKWPHEYIVRERVDEQLFIELVVHIWNGSKKVDIFNVLKVVQTQQGYNSPTMNAISGDCTKLR